MKGFSDERRTHIRRELLEEGRKLFARYGLRKTTMADLTGPVDIAPSTFYQFFDSKEELYIEILEREGERFYERAVEPLEENADPERAIAEYLQVVFEEMETNPLVEGLLADGEWERLRRAYSEAKLIEQRDREIGYLLPYVKAWQESGAIRDGDPEAIALTIESVAMLALHRKEIGEDRYPAVRETVIESVAAGLTTTDREQSDSKESGAGQ